jgi:hypothetical protein
MFDMRGPCAPGPYHPGPNRVRLLEKAAELAPVSIKHVGYLSLCVIWKMLSYIHWPGGTFSTCVGLARLVPIILVPIDCASLNKLPNLRPSPSNKFLVLSLLGYLGNGALDNARLAPYPPGPDRLRLLEQVAKLASVSIHNVDSCSFWEVVCSCMSSFVEVVYMM